jgi:dUTP pyrophosphatase
MILNLYVDPATPDADELRNLYEKRAAEHNEKVTNTNLSDMADAGFDLLVPQLISVSSDQPQPHVLKLDHGVKCSAYFMYSNDACPYTGYYMHPRSSIYKTPFRLANSAGIIDAGYRGTLISMLDCLPVTSSARTIHKHDRLMQICAPDLSPMYVNIVDSLETNTTRGEGGFGSTGGHTTGA